MTVASAVDVEQFAGWLCIAEQLNEGGGLEGHDGSLDDVDTFAQLVLFDDEGRGQADDVTMGGLCQQSVVTKA